MSNQRDLAGNIYQSPDNKPAGHGVQVKIPGGTGTMVGGYVVPNK